MAMTATMAATAALAVGVILAIAAGPCAAHPLAANGTLYGLSETTGLIVIDPATGRQTPIGIPLPAEAQAQNLATLDAQRGIYYMIGYNLSTQVHAETGAGLCP